MTAKSWHLTPSEWDDLSEADRAQMMALEEACSVMQQYENQIAQDEADRQRNMPRSPRRRR